MAKIGADIIPGLLDSFHKATSGQKEYGCKLHKAKLDFRFGYEIFGNNLYFICNMPGLAGNVAFLTYLGDSHFTDMVAVDYTVEIRNAVGGTNRYTRCHVWGGPVTANSAGSVDDIVAETFEIARMMGASMRKRGYSGWASA